MLAIVIPAYKPQFFRLALESVAAQTNKEFKCYVFDDAAPLEIKRVVDNYPDFHYVRFNENMGGRDLVGQWHRCLESIEEEWVWLFSDDDVMSPNCVSEFYKALKSYPNAMAFRFQTKIIDANGQVTHVSKPIKNETGLEFLLSRLLGSYSYMPDHIFNWKKLKEINGGFVKFPLAWCSDDATWCLLGKYHEIVAIPSAMIQIRYSGINICSLVNIETVKVKLLAYRLFYLWCADNFDLSLSHKLKFARVMARYYDILPFSRHFQLPIFYWPIILSILLVLKRKIHKKLKRLKTSTQKK